MEKGLMPPPPLLFAGLTSKWPEWLPIASDPRFQVWCVGRPPSSSSSSHYFHGHCAGWWPCRGPWVVWFHSLACPAWSEDLTIIIYISHMNETLTYSPMSSAIALSAATISVAALSAAALSAAAISAVTLSASTSSACWESCVFAKASMPLLDEGILQELDTRPVLTPKIWLWMGYG